MGFARPFGRGGGDGAPPVSGSQDCEGVDRRRRQGFQRRTRRRGGVVRFPAARLGAVIRRVEERRGVREGRRQAVRDLRHHLRRRRRAGPRPDEPREVRLLSRHRLAREGEGGGHQGPRHGVRPGRRLRVRPAQRRRGGRLPSRERAGNREVPLLHPAAAEHAVLDDYGPSLRCEEARAQRGDEGSRPRAVARGGCGCGPRDGPEGARVSRRHDPDGGGEGDGRRQASGRRPKGGRVARAVLAHGRGAERLRAFRRPLRP